VTNHSAESLEWPIICCSPTSTKISRAYQLPHWSKAFNIAWYVQMHFSRHTERIQHHQLRPVWKGLHYECVLCYFSWFQASNCWLGIDDGARGIVEMLFCTSLIALVGAADQPQSSPRKLQIVNTKVRASSTLCFSQIYSSTFE
jgi:hypothetical protein